MKIKIPTSILNNSDKFFASKREKQKSWQNALKEARTNLLCNDKTFLIKYIKSQGSLYDKTDLITLNAILIQYISQVMEFALDDHPSDTDKYGIDWKAYKKESRRLYTVGYLSCKKDGIYFNLTFYRK